MTSLRFDILSPGWELPDWKGSCYPQDLPEEWRLSYFANEFPSVLVPKPCWLAADTTLLSSWFEDVPDDFRFYLADADATRPQETLDRVRSALGSKLAGRLIETADPLPARHPVPCFECLAPPPSIPRVGCLPAWRLPDDGLADLRSTRRRLQALVAQSPSDRGLLLADKETSNQELHQWWDLLWLMGIALS